MTLYQIKPLFQSLLRPTMFWLYKHHVTANHITLAALALSLLTGLLLMLVAQPILFMLLPIVLFRGGYIGLFLLTICLSVLIALSCIYYLYLWLGF